LEKLQDIFDGDKLLSEYKTMSVEEVASFLGQEHAETLMQRLGQGNVTKEEIYDICKDAYPEYKLRSDWIGDIIVSKLPGQGKYLHLNEQGVSDEKISIVQKLDNYEAKIQNGTLKECELQDICNIVFGKDSDICKKVYESLKVKVLPDEIEEYTSYREQLNQTYLENQNREEILISSFEMIDGDIKYCKHTLEKIEGSTKIVLMEKTFEFDTGLQQHFLEPALIDFAQHNRIETDNILKNERNTYSADYEVFSSSNNTLKLININPAYANTVAYVLSQIEPIALEKQESKSGTLEQAYQKNLSKSGFANALGIIEMIVFTISILIFLFFVFKLIFVI